MKKVLIGMLILVISICSFAGTIVYADTPKPTSSATPTTTPTKIPTLEEIANKFNAGSWYKNFYEKMYDYTCKATAEGNKLNIDITGKNTNKKVQYNLNGTVLTSSFSIKDIEEIYLAQVLIISIGQLHGYSEYDYFIPDIISSYSVGKEGFEVKYNLNSGKYEVKIDISKKYPAIEKDYITVWELAMKVGKLNDEKSTVTYSSGKIEFMKKENVLLIAEKDELTKNTYKSLISILETMFENVFVSEYFEENYADISVGNKEFEGFKIEVNPSGTEWEEKVKDGYKLMKVTINKSQANKALDNYKNEYLGLDKIQELIEANQSAEAKIKESEKLAEYYSNLYGSGSKKSNSEAEKNNSKTAENNTQSITNNNNEEKEKTQSENSKNKEENKTTMPKTGKEQNPILIIPYTAIVLTCIGIVALIITRKR